MAPNPRLGCGLSVKEWNHRVDRALLYTVIFESSTRIEHSYLAEE
jgi:hypothetical protein